mmetsp:Transcript_26045/g.53358  ORF Transcript_26045/g.53358 Transcript_26045/m.53358 type:complete len:83 (-) Transcript_26045:156-404(-)
MYQRGEGVDQDYDEVERWFQKAADQGHAEAQQLLVSLRDCGGFKKLRGLLKEQARAEAKENAEDEANRTKKGKADAGAVAKN